MHLRDGGEWCHLLVTMMYKKKKAAKTAFSDLLSKDSGSNYYLQVKTINEGVLIYNIIHIMYIICRLRTRSMD